MCHLYIMYHLFMCMHLAWQVFSQPSAATRDWMAAHRRLLCHVGGPHCGGSADEMRTPVAAVHVRRGDSCDRERNEPGPFLCRTVCTPTPCTFPSVRC